MLKLILDNLDWIKGGRIMITYDEMLRLFSPDVIDSIANIHKRQTFSELERKLLVFYFSEFLGSTR